MKLNIKELIITTTLLLFTNTSLANCKGLREAVSADNIPEAQKILDSEKCNAKAYLDYPFFKIDNLYTFSLSGESEYRGPRPNNNNLSIKSIAMSELLLKHGLDSKRFFASVLHPNDYETSCELINFGLQQGMSRDQLLEATLNLIYNCNIDESYEEHPFYSTSVDPSIWDSHLAHNNLHKYIAFGLDKKTNLSKINIFHGRYTVNNNVILELFDLGFDPNDLVQLVLATLHPLPTESKWSIQYPDNTVKKIANEIQWLSNVGADLNTIKYFEITPSFELSKTLLKRGLDPDLFIDLVEKTVPIIEKIDPSSQHSNRFFSAKLPPRMTREKQNLVSLAVRYGAKYREIDDTPAHEIIELFKNLHNDGYDENNINLATDKNGRTFLILAAKAGYYGLIQRHLHPIIFSNKINFNKKDNLGKTALMYSAENGHKNVVEFLVKNGADITITDKKGKTAYDLARKSKKLDKKFVEMLKPNSKPSKRWWHIEL